MKSKPDFTQFSQVSLSNVEVYEYSLISYSSNL